MALEPFVFNVAQLSAVLVAWIATYFVHSTLLLAGAWVISRFIRAHRTLDALWKTAVLGALITASLQMVPAVRPAGGTHDASRVIEREVWKDAALSLPENATPGAASVYPARLADVSATLRLIPVSLVILWAIYAGFILGRVLFATSRARAALGERQEVADSGVIERFRSVAARLELKKPIALTLSAEVSSPVALGQTEICVPARLVSDLTPAEQESVLAHEIAHVIRRDPLWLLATVTIESILFFQPLNRVARMHIQKEAEFLADDLAVEKASSGLVLARCLARVAEWMSGSQTRLLAPAFVEQKGSLAMRIQRLLENDPADSTVQRERMAPRIALALALPLLVLLVAPGFTGGGKRPWGTPAFHWEGSVPPGKSVEIKGLMGNIRAEPSNSRTVVVNATRHGRATVPDVRFAVVQHEGGVTICTIYPVPTGVAPNPCEPGAGGRSYNTRANDVEIEYLVRVPSGIAFAAHSATGNISSGRLTGPIAANSSAGKIDVETDSYVEASTLSGNVKVRMGATDWKGTLRISSNAGNLRVTLPRAASTAVFASSSLGKVESDFPLDGKAAGFFARLKPRGSFGNSLEGIIGGDGATAGAPRTLELESMTGNIAIQRRD